jgi:hypothetical protein
MNVSHNRRPMAEELMEPAQRRLFRGRPPSRYAPGQPGDEPAQCACMCRSGQCLPCRRSNLTGKYSRYTLIRDAMTGWGTTLRCCLLMLCGSLQVVGLVSTVLWFLAHAR